MASILTFLGLAALVPSAYACPYDDKASCYTTCPYALRDPFPVTQSESASHQAVTDSSYPNCLQVHLDIMQPSLGDHRLTEVDTRDPKLQLYQLPDFGTTFSKSTSETVRSWAHMAGMACGDSGFYATTEGGNEFVVFDNDPWIRRELIEGVPEHQRAEMEHLFDSGAFDMNEETHGRRLTSGMPYTGDTIAIPLPDHTFYASGGTESWLYQSVINYGPKNAFGFTFTESVWRTTCAKAVGVMFAYRCANGLADNDFLMRNYGLPVFHCTFPGDVKPTPIKQSCIGAYQKCGGALPTTCCPQKKWDGTMVPYRCATDNYGGTYMMCRP